MQNIIFFSAFCNISIKMSDAILPSSSSGIRSIASNAIPNAHLCFFDKYICFPYQCFLEFVYCCSDIHDFSNLLFINFFTTHKPYQLHSFFSLFLLFIPFFPSLTIFFYLFFRPCHYQPSNSFSCDTSLWQLCRTDIVNTLSFSSWLIMAHLISIKSFSISLSPYFPPQSP